MTHFQYIDILRLYAVLIVVGDHFLGGTTGGYLGVDIFFVISGFVFAHTFITDKLTGSYVVAYYIKRAYRIAPAMMLVVMLTVLFSYFVLPSGDIRNLIESGVASLLLNANNYFYLTQDYFAPDANYIPLLHFWSLGVEEQFYLIFPLILLLASLKKIKFAWVLNSIGIASLLIFIYMPYPESFYLLPARMYQFIAGIAVYNLGKNRRVTNFPIFVIFLILLFISPFLPYGNEKVGVAVCTILTSVYLYFMPISLDVPRNISLKFRKLGLLTYPVYLIHQPLIVFLKILFELKTNLINFIFYVSACVFLAFYIELVADNFKSKSSTARSIVGLKMNGIVFTWLAILGFCTALYGFRLNDNLLIERDKQAYIDKIFSTNYGLAKACSSLNSDELNCFSNENEVLYWGDSYAMHVASSAVLTELSSGQATMSSCAPILNLSKINNSNTKERAQSCIDFNDNVKEKINKSQNLERVVIASIFDFDDDTNLLIKDNLVVEYDYNKLTSAFNETLIFLLNKGLEVVVVLPTPTDNTNLGMCLKRALMYNNSLDRCQFIDDKHTEFETYLKKVWKENIFDPADVICNENKCSASLDGIPLYIDDGHISKSGSLIVFKDLH